MKLLKTWSQFLLQHFPAEHWGVIWYMQLYINNAFHRGNKNKFKQHKTDTHTHNPLTSCSQ